MKKILKTSLYFFVRRFTRIRLLWLAQSLNFFIHGKTLSVRSESENHSAENFRRYWERLDSEQRIEYRRKLIRNLDNDSILTVDNFIYRQNYIAGHNIIEQGKLFTKEEISEQKECSSEIHRLSGKMAPYHFSFLPSECFYGISGLRWLPQAAIEKIKNGIFIDAGACEGDTAIFLKSKFKPKHLYAFEPDNKNYKILEHNCQLAGQESFTLIQAGLSNEMGTAHLSRNGSESHLSNNNDDQIIKLIKFDDYWAKENKSNNKVSLIKIDIEGAEISALKGMEQTIRKQKPVLAISIYHRPEDFFQIKPWLETICSEYKYIIKKATPFSLTGETMLLAYID